MIGGRPLSAHLPDPVLRFAIRRLLGRRLATEEGLDPDSLRTGPIAIATDDANRQHYEVPPEFYELVLGPRRKYSCAHFGDDPSDPGDRSLAEAEEAMLAETCANVGITDGMTILDLGCGWGSLSRYVAEQFPGCEIVAVSNSASQRAHIDAAGHAQITTITADVNEFDTERRFDRVVSIEMFEHLRNWEAIIGRIGTWLAPEGRLFIHVFCHRSTPYRFETGGRVDWMARHFFTGGIMPSWDLPDHFAEVEQRWRYDGRHYEHTANAWLANLDRNRPAVLALFSDVYGPGNAELWFARWRLFFLACAELFGFRGGQEWFVGHYLLRP